jgi:hypothetical protein
MKTGIITPESAAHLFATMKVAEQVSRGELSPDALGRNSESGYYSRRFLRDVADGVPVAWAAVVDVVAAAREGTAIVALAYEPGANRLTVEFGTGDRVVVTSTFDNGRMLAVRVATEDDPSGVSAASEALWLDRMEVSDGCSGVSVRADLLPPVAADVRSAF